MPFNKRDGHQAVSSELEELAAAFALETLEIDEGDAYRDHLRACPVCRGLLGELQTVVNILPVALDVTPTRSELKDLILAEAMADFESEFTGPLVELLKAEDYAKNIGAFGGYRSCDRRPRSVEYQLAVRSR